MSALIFTRRQLRLSRRILSWALPHLAVICICSAASLLLPGACQGQGREYRREHARPGTFSYYILSLSWAPAFCSQESGNRSSRECDSGRHTGFVVHGLWPQGDTGRPVEYCGNVPPASHGIVEDMLSIMPDRSLIQHEWRAHGSCSGLSPRDYFSTVRRAYSQIRVPKQFQSTQKQFNMDPLMIEQSFQASSGLPDSSVVRVACRQGELSEVRICFSKDLHPVPCTASVRECRVPKVFVRPIP